MTDQTLIQIAKSVTIDSYLLYRGIQPVSRIGERLVYYSPLRAESTPSFTVNKQINRFKDFGSSEKGDDVIRLVQLLNHCTFSEAVNELCQFANQPEHPTFFLSGQNTQPTQTIADCVKAVKLLENKALVRYAESRQISYQNARKYLKEVYYTHNGHNLFAVGF